MADAFDVINDHSGPLGGALGGALTTPVCHTVHGPLMGEPGEIYSLLGAVSPSVGLISVSDNQRSPLPELNWLGTCHNAIPMDEYPLDTGNDGYLLFLGRMSPDKGAHHAVRVAQETGLPLKLAGKMQEAHERAHFDEHVRPHLDGSIEYVGEVSHDEKVALLQRAGATVFPIQWPEPFGLVMVESMACGTPVVATRMGAVPEVIEHGRSGMIVDEPAQLAGVVEEALALDPGDVRASVVERFSSRRMVSDYVECYQRLLATAS
jgi:glycosyltransferase involved in cell wall biosynthesis